MKEGTFKDGEPDGLWTEWYENGQKDLEGTYKDGKKDGLWISWYENGQKEWEETWKAPSGSGGYSKSISKKRWWKDGSVRY